MPRTIFLYVVVAALLIAGCGPLSAPMPLKTPTAAFTVADGNWTIKMTQSGGIMGLSRSIEVSSDGKFIVVDERANKTVTGELPADGLLKINEQVTSAEYIPPVKPDGMACADCFIYDLEIQRSGEKFAAQLNDISLPNSGLESLVTQLRGLIETTLK